MKLRRIVSCILAGAMALSLAACGVNDDKGSEQYVFSDNRLCFLSDEDVKFVEQGTDFVKVYDKADLTDDGVHIAIDPAITYQTIEGFGASMTDASVYLLSQLPEEELNDVMVKLFDKEKGIGASIIRNPIGSCDFSLEYYTYDDMPAGEEDRELEHFDMSRAQAQMGIVKNAKEVNPDIKLILSSWTVKFTICIVI